MGNIASFMPDFETTKLPLAIPGKPNLQAIYGPWNNQEEAREALEWFNTTRDPEGAPITEIPAGSTVAIYDDNLHTSVTEYWWKDGGLVLKSSNNSMIYTIVTDYDFIVYNDIIPTPKHLKVMRINYGLNNISLDMQYGKLAYKVDEGEWKYINHTILEDEEVVYDNINKCFVFYLNNLRPLTLIQFRWYATNNDGSLGELLTTKSLLVTATANDVLELYYPKYDSDQEKTITELIDLNTLGKRYKIESGYEDDSEYYPFYLKNNHIVLETSGRQWLDYRPAFGFDHPYSHLYKISRTRKYGRWQPFSGPDLVFEKGKDGNIKYEEVFYVTNEFGAHKLIDTAAFNNQYEQHETEYDDADEFTITGASTNETWTRTCTEVSSENIYRYARKRFLDSSGSYTVDWSYPYLHATYKPSDSYENIYKKAKKDDFNSLTLNISDINTYLELNPGIKFSDIPADKQYGWSYSALSIDEPGDIICLAYRGFSEDTTSSYQGPFIIGSYGENGLDGGNVEYIYKSSNEGTIEGFVKSVTGQTEGEVESIWNTYARSLLNTPDLHGNPYQDGIDGEYIINGWSDDRPERDAAKPYIYMIHRKYNGTTKSWGLYSLPKLWDLFVPYELIISNTNPQIPSRTEGYSALAAKNATMTTIKLFSSSQEISSGVTLNFNPNIYTTVDNVNYWFNDGIDEYGVSCVVHTGQVYPITVTAKYKGVDVASQTIYITRLDTDTYLLHVNPDTRVYLGEEQYSVSNYVLYVTKLDIDGNYAKDESGNYLLVLDDINTEGTSNYATCMKFESNPLSPATQLEKINEFLNNPFYSSNDLMLYLYHWKSEFLNQDGTIKLYSLIKTNLGERLYSKSINTINAAEIIGKVDIDYQVVLNYDTLNIPSSKINDNTWFSNHKIQTKVIHNGEVYDGSITASIDLISTTESSDLYIIDSQGNKVHSISGNGALDVLISSDLPSDAVLTISANITYDSNSENGTYQLVKSLPIHIYDETNITYEFVPNVTSIGLVWNYGHATYVPNALAGSLYRVNSNVRKELTLNNSGLILSDTEPIGSFHWELINRNGTKIDNNILTPQVSNLENKIGLDGFRIAKFCYTIDGTNYTYDIPVSQDLQQSYSISIKGTADGNLLDAALAVISLLEGNVVKNSVDTGNRTTECILLAVFDTSNELSLVNNTTIYSLSQLDSLYNVLNSTYKNNKYIVCLASYKQIRLTSELYSLLHLFGLGDLEYVLIGNNSAKTPFAFIGLYGLEQGKAFCKEENAQATASSVYINSRIINNTLDFTKDGENGTNGYPGCITRMFKTNVVAGKTYYNQTKSNPNDLEDGVCKLDYMVVFDGTAYYAFVAKYTHTINSAPDTFLNSDHSINTLNYTFNDVKNSDGTSATVSSASELWQPVLNMDGSAFFTSFTAVSGYIETLSGSAILLTENTNGSSYINAGFRTSLDLDDDDIVLWSGSKLPKETEDGKIKTNAVDASAKNATFRVTKDGTLYAKRGMFEGSVVSVPATQNLWAPLGNRMNLWLQTYNDLIDSAKNFNRDRFVSRGFDYTSWGAESVKIKGLQIISTNSDFIPVVGTGSMTAIDKVHDINSGLSCVIQQDPNSTENILIDLPCYTDKFNIRYYSNEGYYPITTIKSSTNNIPDENFTLVYNYDTWSKEESRLSPIECLEFSINPTLVNKGINMWLNDKQFELEDIDKIAATNEMLHRLWVESFIDKEFTLIISTEENGSEVLPPDNIFIRGIERNILHEKEVNPYEDHPYFNIYPEGMIKCQDLIMGKALPTPGEYIDVSYFSNTYSNDEYYSYPNGNTIYPYYTGSMHGNMLIIMKFKCKSLYGKAEYARRPSSSSESLYTKEFDYYDIYWDLERYDIVSSPDISLITIKNDIKYF